MTFSEYLTLNIKPYGPIVFDVAATALTDYFPGLNTAITAASAADEVIETQQDNIHLTGGISVSEQGATGRMLSVTMRGGYVVSIYDTNGNLIYRP